MSYSGKEDLIIHGGKRGGKMKAHLRMTDQDGERLRQLKSIENGNPILSGRPKNMSFLEYKKRLREQKQEIRNRVKKPFWWAKGLAKIDPDTGMRSFKIGWHIMPMGQYFRPHTEII